MATQNVMNYEGNNYFRHRLVQSTLSGKSVRISKIRHKDENPGLREPELCFLKLLEKMTNGSKIVINETGTTVLYHPGLLIGGSFDHECHKDRAIGYYLEPLMCIAPFAKKPLKVVLRGVTNDQYDPSVDQIRFSSLPVLKTFLGTDELDLKTTRRGPAPEGGGEVVFTCPCRQKLRPLNFTEPGKVKKIRGTAWCVRVAPATVNRLVEAARSILNKFIPDIYIHTDHCRGKECGKSPGFGLTLVAETTKGAYLSAEAISNPKGSEGGPSTAEEIGTKAAYLLLEEIYRGGCVDSTNQSMAALLMVLGAQDVSKVQTGLLSPYTMGIMKHIRDFFQVMFKVDEQKKDEDEEELKQGGQKLILTCVGVGYSNITKAIM